MPSVMTRAFAIEAVGEIVATNIVEPKNVKGTIEIEEVGMSIDWIRVVTGDMGKLEAADL